VGLDVPFAVRLAHVDGYARVTLHGDLDYAATTQHADALREVMELHDHVVLNLADVEFIDSAWLRFLAQLADAHGGHACVEEASGPVRRLIEFTGLDSVVEFVD
jgi:anti-anti-sigma factor